MKYFSVYQRKALIYNISVFLSDGYESLRNVLQEFYCKKILLLVKLESIFT